MTLSLIKNNFFYCEKVIYQTYECDFDELPAEYKNNSIKWLDFHPEWKLHYSNSYQRKEEIIKELNLSKSAIKCFEYHPGITQADFWRLTVIHKTGGVYADLDSIPTSINSSEKIINSLSKKIELIAMPDGYQLLSDTGSNTSNFIFSRDSFIGKEFMKVINESLEIGGYFLKNNQLPPDPNIGTMFNWTLFNNIDLVSQTYDESYVSHSQDYKPENYRDGTEIWKKERFFGENKYDKGAPILPYTKEWGQWYNISTTSM